MIEVTIPGRPVPWARVGTGHTAKKQANHRKTVAQYIWAVAKRARMKPFEGPLSLFCQFTPEHTRIQIRELEPNGHEAKTTRPDIDNLVKQIMEALEDSGIIGDDSQVSVLHAEKWK